MTNDISYSYLIAVRIIVIRIKLFFMLFENRISVTLFERYTKAHSLKLNTLRINVLTELKQSQHSMIVLFSGKRCSIIE